MTFSIRAATIEDAEIASALVHVSFRHSIAKDWSPEACDRFFSETPPTVLGDKIGEAAYAAIAELDGVIVGFLLMPEPARLTLLFVHPDHLRRGVGRALWERARSHIETVFPQTKTIEVNAAPSAVEFYRALGFAPISSQYSKDGARAVRMACWLPARGLNAEPR